MEAGYEGSVLVPLVDPQAVEAAFKAGIGKTVVTTVGGALDSRRHQPIKIEAKVHMLSDGRFVNESHGSLWYAGNTAVLHFGNVAMVVISRAVHLYDRSLFLAHGQDPQRFDVVVVKSPHCQPQFYSDWAACIVNVDAPGATSANLHSLGHTRVARPIFPLDKELDFHPEAMIFRRN
jgi:microcystin degradation protein MlrC